MEDPLTSIGVAAVVVETTLPVGEAVEVSLVMVESMMSRCLSWMKRWCWNPW